MLQKTFQFIFVSFGNRLYDDGDVFSLYDNIIQYRLKSCFAIYKSMSTNIRPKKSRATFNRLAHDTKFPSFLRCVNGD